MNHSNIKRWPKPSGNVTRRRPERIDLAADYGFLNAVSQLEKQWGTIEAYNRIVEYCDTLRSAIDNGSAKPPEPYVNASYVRKPIPKHWKERR